MADTELQIDEYRRMYEQRSQLPAARRVYLDQGAPHPSMYSILEGPYGPVTGVSWSPDGRYLAVRHLQPPQSTVFDFAGGTPTQLPPLLLSSPTVKMPLPVKPDHLVHHFEYSIINGDSYDWGGDSPVGGVFDAWLEMQFSPGGGVAWSADGKYLYVGSNPITPWTEYESLRCGTTPWYNFLVYEWTENGAVSPPMEAYPAADHWAGIWTSETIRVIEPQGSRFVIAETDVIAEGAQNGD
jgi:WD40 repeat protein